MKSLGRLLLLLAVGLAALSSARAATPNVVLIVSDDQAWGDFGFMGHPVVRTPHLDRLASQSAVFTHGYVPTSLCRASLASIVTGLYPHQHKITSNDPPAGTDRRWMLRHMSAQRTLPRLLAARGYASLQTGKWWEGHYSLGGFTHGMTHGVSARGGRHGDEGLKIGREGMEPVFEFIRAAEDRPFFVWYAPMMPHTPHNPPERLLARYRDADRHIAQARYWAMCEWFDETCGQLLDFLDEQGLSENTLVAFVVDNGWIQDTTAPDQRRSHFAPKSKRSPYDGGLRTPILLRLPGRIEPGRHDHLVSSLDLLPTIAALCGAEADPDLPGIDLLALLSGNVEPREALFGATFSHDAVDLDEPASNLQYRWCVAEGHKLIVPADGQQPSELYDLEQDPTEEVDRASDDQPTVSRLRERLDGWWSVP